MTAITSTRAEGVLEAIVAAARTMVAVRRRLEPIEDLADRASTGRPGGAAFREALAHDGRINVIAECKRRSPARGLLRHDYRPDQLARAYEEGGAAAVSVVTEPTFFDGSLDHLRRVKAAVRLPLLRKDFIVDEYQLLEARAAGADAILLIVAALSAEALESLLRAAARLGLAALVETHTSDEVRRGIDAGATIIGVNSRNLSTLEVDRRASDGLIRVIPRGCVAVAESGIRSRDDVRHLHDIGFQAFLIGEWLATADDPRGLLASVVTMPAGGLLGPGDQGDASA